MVQSKEVFLLSQIVSCSHYIPGRVHPIQLMFFDKCTGNQERVVATLILTSKIQDAGQILESGSDHHNPGLSAIDIKVVK